MLVVVKASYVEYIILCRLSQSRSIRQLCYKCGRQVHGNRAIQDFQNYGEILMNEPLCQTNKWLKTDIFRYDPWYRSRAILTDANPMKRSNTYVSVKVQVQLGVAVN